MPKGPNGEDAADRTPELPIHDPSDAWREKKDRRDNMMEAAEIRHVTKTKRRELDLTS